MLMTSSQVLKKPPPVTGSMRSLRQCAGQQSIAYGAAYTLPSGAVSEDLAIGSRPPALSLNFPTSDVRSAYSPCVYQYTPLALFSSGGAPAASAAVSLMSCCGEPGIDCHSTVR